MGAFHLPRKFREHTFSWTFHWKVPGTQVEFWKGDPVFPLEIFRWKSMFHLRGFTRDLCHHLEFWWQEHNRMELVSNGTRSSLVLDACFPPKMLGTLNALFNIGLHTVCGWPTTTRKWRHNVQNSSGTASEWFHCKVLPPAVLDTNFLDTRHWASEFKKSLAHEEKPLVQEELKWFETLQVSDTCKVSNFVACTRPGFRTFLTLYRVQIEIFRSVTKAEFEFAYHYCSSPYKFHSMNRNQGYVFF